MTADIWAAVARRLLLQQSCRQSPSASASNEQLILVASVIFHFSWATAEVSNETFNSWLHAIANSFHKPAQLQVRQSVESFRLAEPECFNALWNGPADCIYKAIQRFEQTDERMRKALRAALFVFASEQIERNPQTIAEKWTRLAAENLPNDEWDSQISLNATIHCLLNQEIGERALPRNRPIASFAQKIEVEVVQ